MLSRSWENMQYDVKLWILLWTAFHGTLSEEIYMNSPNGMDIEGNTCLSLRKTIYVLVQSAREFYKKLICELKDPLIVRK
jgi:hypothetical protein